MNSTHYYSSTHHWCLTLVYIILFIYFRWFNSWRHDQLPFNVKHSYCQNICDQRTLCFLELLMHLGRFMYLSRSTSEYTFTDFTKQSEVYQTVPEILTFFLPCPTANICTVSTRMNFRLRTLQLCVVTLMTLTQKQWNWNMNVLIARIGVTQEQYDAWSAECCPQCRRVLARCSWDDSSTRG